MPHARSVQMKFTTCVTGLNRPSEDSNTSRPRSTANSTGGSTAFRRLKYFQAKVDGKRHGWFYSRKWYVPKYKLSCPISLCCRAHPDPVLSQMDRNVQEVLDFNGAPSASVCLYDNNIVNKATPAEMYPRRCI